MYNPCTSKYTKGIIKDIENYLEFTNNSITTIDTLDLCHLVGAIKQRDRKIKSLQTDNFRLSTKCDNALEILKTTNESIPKLPDYKIIELAIDALERGK